MDSSELCWSFQPQSLIYLVGPSQVGKSEFALRCLQDNAALLGGSESNKPLSLTYLYNFHNPMVHKISQLPLPNVVVRQGLDPAIIETPEDYFGMPQKGLGHILVIDDLGTESANSPAVTRLFTQGVHHLNLTIIIINHSIFFEGKERKLQQQQATYMVLFKSPRSLDSVCRLSQQLGGLGSLKALKFAFSCICAQDYTPLVIDLSKDTDQQLMLVSNILPEQYPVVVYTE